MVDVFSINETAVEVQPVNARLGPSTHGMPKLLLSVSSMPPWEWHDDVEAFVAAILHYSHEFCWTRTLMNMGSLPVLTDLSQYCFFLKAIY